MGSKVKNSKPPRFANWLLKSFCSYDFLPSVLWDMEEIYLENLQDKGPIRAKTFYYLEALSVILHLFFKGKSQYSINKTAMLKHNILISLRSFKRFKSTFFINLIGLATGLAATLLIYLWVTDELSMDKFHSHNERLYQVMQNSETASGVMSFPWTPLQLGQTLIERFPEVENATTTYEMDPEEGESFLSFGNEYFSIKDQWVDEHFFEVLNFPLVQGSSKSFFEQRNNVLISKSLAEKLFTNTEEAIGKTVNLKNTDFDTGFIVAGIFEDVPSNSTIQFDALFHLATYVAAQAEYFPNWTSNNTITYTLLQPGTDLTDFNQKIYGLTESFEPNAQSKLFVQRLDQRHLYGSYRDGKVSGGRIAYVQLFSMVAIVILVIACINFMNLSTAKANTRLKELGVKKALGVKRSSVIGQYLTESFLLTIFSVMVGYILALACLPVFNHIIGKELSFQFNANIVLGTLIITIITALLAGSYPAIYLSRIKTVTSLKGVLNHSLGDMWARKGLVVFQFCVSIILIVSVLIISNQIGYIQSKNLGYDRDNVLSFQFSSLDDNDYNRLLEEIKSFPGVLNVTGADHNLTGNNGRTGGVNWPGRQDRLSFLNLETGMNFVETMDIEVVEGRSFDPAILSDFDKVLFNETAIAQMGLEDPIGQTVQIWGREKQIIGIVKDFHVETLYNQISPTLIQVYNGALSQVFVKIQAGTELQTIGQIEEVYTQINEGLPFNFSFVEDNYQQMYKAENQVASLAKSFTFIAIIISCLGLFGLSAFTTERRSKEISIRKVLGSGNWRIVEMLTKDFAKLVLASLLFGLPISYLLASNWLSDFEFRIGLELWYFLVAGILILSISWLTIGLQTFKAARANPIDALRLE